MRNKYYLDTRLTKCRIIFLAENYVGIKRTSGVMPYGPKLIQVSGIEWYQGFFFFFFFFLILLGIHSSIGNDS